MAFVYSKKKGSGGRGYIDLKDFEKGDILINGYFVGVEKNKWETLEYVFRQKEDDSVISIKQHSDLKEQMEDLGATEGDLVEIIYDGSFVMTKGKGVGKTRQCFIVGVDQEQRLAMNSAREKLDSKPGKAPVKTKADQDKLNKFADEAL